VESQQAAAAPPASPPPPAAGAEITGDAVGAVHALAAWPEVWIEFPVLSLDGGNYIFTILTPI
jgi:hypothetical protein